MLNALGPPRLITNVLLSEVVNTHVKRSLVAALTSVVVVVLLLAGLRMPSGGPDVFSMVLLPFYMVGVMFSHNAHQPDEVATYSSMFIFFFIVTFTGQVLWSRWHRST